MHPQSIAIIPDGNRRYAHKNGLGLQAAYGDGFKKVAKVAQWAQEADVKRLGFWALSLENFNQRSATELKTLFHLMKSHISEAISETGELSKRDASVRFFGRLDLLPSELRGAMAELERKTEGNDSLKLDIAVAYSGQDEFLHAARGLALDVKEGKLSLNDIQSLGTDGLKDYLYFPYSPDLIIRTGKVQRLSGFLPLQSAYSEFYFSNRLWPEFAKADFNRAIAYYDSAERRFGK
ncbi:di-trans,poly-cis-decaprenylcistransferase [Candidatus Micrarchaeota archaeon]|nr:di-trans,poly-cis-decaprenylcistransferase [Candidatus Micrarchaeota archaeon]MBI5176891.1 di-trans,poly-cis-decaprenylcistransferase [Candidatus Micrarchaeota archaeon]